MWKISIRKTRNTFTSKLTFFALIIYRKNIDKLSAFIDSEELIIKQKYNIDKTTNMSELSDKDHLNYLKEISSLLFGQFKKFNWIA